MCNFFFVGSVVSFRRYLLLFARKKLILCLLRRYRMGAASLQFDSLIERDTSFSCHSIDFNINKNATFFNWSGNDWAILSRWTLISNLIECNRLQNVLKNMFELRSGKCLSWLVSDHLFMHMTHCAKCSLSEKKKWPRPLSHTQLSNEMRLTFLSNKRFTTWTC